MTAKWIGGILGFITAGPLGALLGVLFGTMVDGLLTADGDASPFSDPFNTSSSSSSSSADPRFDQGSRNSFLFSFLVLASYVIRADGRVMHSEMELVRATLRQNFGDAAAQQGDDILRRLFDRQKQVGADSFAATVRDCCGQIAAHLDHSQRLQLLHFLVLIAQADGHVHPSEVDALRRCAGWLGMSAADVDSLLGLGHDDLDSSYRVLGCTPDSTDDELRRAYRRLALEHHPDRVATLGDDVRRAAEKKFQEINAAKDRIWKSRGMR